MWHLLCSDYSVRRKITHEGNCSTIRTVWLSLFASKWRHLQKYAKEQSYWKTEQHTCSTIHLLYVWCAVKKQIKQKTDNEVSYNASRLKDTMKEQFYASLNSLLHFWTFICRLYSARCVQLLEFISCSGVVKRVGLPLFTNIFGICYLWFVVYR